MVRTMTIEDYQGVHDLWMTIKGFAIRSIDDSREGVERFLKRNPATSVVAEENGEIVGSILCGHDGRRGCLYHVCVREDCRMRGIGKSMVVRCMEELEKEKISKVSLIAFTENDIGNAFWKEIGWTKREDLNYYDFVLNRENIINYNK
ncbi:MULTISPECIES: GNAT family N-acetyltransferase [Suilimivivens]|uniref:GNAT family N-acetyltransferase n=1 Tax=Suilimivivens aceti TaxID=2981774 RepID=A0ABT2T375_9FIRM|nr:GNAT family N-acetyltransferase [Suilimivivens aceti]MCU6744486.1 GNAT family N-acetyltransferase [Suilimivivens aceti]RHV48453.1 GNAT family N-acetyltransferase [Lachnospiraceae bacterium OM04-12BH]